MLWCMVIGLANSVALARIIPILDTINEQCSLMVSKISKPWLANKYYFSMLSVKEILGEKKLNSIMVFTNIQENITRQKQITHPLFSNSTLSCST